MTRARPRTAPAPRRITACLAALACGGCSSMRASIDIDAPPERVWAVVTDVEHYKDWNPFLTAGRGSVAEGAALELTMSPVGRPPRTFSPTVLEVKTPRRLVWRGRLVMPGLFDGTHRLIVESLDAGRTRFTQEETFRGLLVPFVGFEPYLAGWRRMDEALKARAEAPSDAGR